MKERDPVSKPTTFCEPLPGDKPIPEDMELPVVAQVNRACKGDVDYNSPEWSDGHETGEAEGYERGLLAGDTKLKRPETARITGSAAWTAGYEEGKAEGYNKGHSAGVNMSRVLEADEATGKAQRDLNVLGEKYHAAVAERDTRLMERDDYRKQLTRVQATLAIRTGERDEATGKVLELKALIVQANSVLEPYIKMINRDIKMIHYSEDPAKIDTLVGALRVALPHVQAPGDGGQRFPQDNIDQEVVENAIALGTADNPDFVYDDPDFIYDPDAWEETYSWRDRDNLAEEVMTGLIHEAGPKEYATLIKGPPKWAALIGNRDEDGDLIISETDIRWFTSLEAAKAAAEAEWPPTLIATT